MKRSIIFTILALSALTLEAKELTTSLNEKIALKKLTGYWEEKDEALSETALIEFLNKYPQSAYCDQLHAMLGDLYFSQKHYPQAIEAYAQIQERKMQQRAAFRYLHSLYEAKHFEEFLACADATLKHNKFSKEERDILHFELAEASYHLGGLRAAQEQEKLFQQAISYYKKLQGTPFEQDSLLPLAELYVFFQDYPYAVKTYQQLAKLTEGNAEEFLFYAGSLQVLYDKPAALRTFDQVFNLKGALSKKAGYNLLSLLFQMQRYQDVITASIHIDNHLPEDKQVIAQYYLGKSLFYEKDFEGAVEILEELFQDDLSQELRQHLTLTLLSCAKELHDLSLCDRIAKHLNTQDPLLETTLCIHASLSREHKEWAIAREDLQVLLDHYPDHKEKASLSYDLALLLMQEGKEEEASEAFASFLTLYPDSPHKKDAMRNLLHLRSLSVKKGGNETEFAALLEKMLQEQDLFSPQELKDNLFLLAQTHTRLKQLSQARQELTAFVTSYPNDPLTSQAYLLLAHCLQHENPQLYASALEQALSLNGALDQESKWHRLLFNTYIQLCTQASAEEKSHWRDLAAEHLFKVTDGSISLNNQRWLASYYLDNPKYQERAIQILERIVHFGSTEPLISLETESEVMRLSSLYKEAKEYEKGAQLLKALCTEQKEKPDRDWKYLRMAQFELGRFYTLLGQYEQAVDLYQQLISSSSHVLSYFALAAQLELAKLTTRDLDSLQKEEQRKQIAQACDLLKEIEIKRQIVSEPLHIEASLCYVDLKTKLALPTLQDDKKSLLLEQSKKELLKLDIGESIPEDKRALIANYLAYIDIQLAYLKKEISLQKTKEELHNLMTHVYNQALLDRVTKTLDELDHPL